MDLNTLRDVYENASKEAHEIFEQFLKCRDWKLRSELKEAVEYARDCYGNLQAAEIIAMGRAKSCQDGGIDVGESH